MNLRVLIAGICGRMGGRVAELMSMEDDLDVVAGVESRGNVRAGGSVELRGRSVPVFVGYSPDVPVPDVVVDFSSPAGTTEALAFCLERGVALVTGTTGNTEEGIRQLRTAAERIAVLVSPNMSRGVSLMDGILPQVRRAAGGQCDVEIVEKHHRAKKDSPSGTAIRLARTLEQSVGAAGRKVVIHSVRAGDVVGEHTVIFGMSGERIEIKHVAESRDCFAHGTIACVRFLAGRPPGWYTMSDVLAAYSAEQADRPR
ncbi:MAG: 4-hydroxy-tetrahydrodipicolinate reductase [Candidatus Eisenbacteria bacterium]|nr:4-hydroxy-tetrahydrodipicolinate reductase [Candidatus Eisenbacteria bacterium]